MILFICLCLLHCSSTLTLMCTALCGFGLGAADEETVG